MAKLKRTIIAKEPPPAQPITRYSAIARELMDLLPFDQQSEIEAVLDRHFGWKDVSTPPDNNRRVGLLVGEDEVIEGRYAPFSWYDNGGYELSIYYVKKWCEMPEIDPA